MTCSLVGLTLHVSDLDRSVEFYRQLPGAKVVMNIPGQFAIVAIGQGRLGLLADQRRPFHVELEVPDLDQAAEELRDTGISVDGPTTRRWGQRDILVTDPDGNLLEFAVTQSPETQE